MSGFYNQRPYVGGGPIAKKPRMGPRNSHMMGGPGHHLHHQPQPEEVGKRLLSFKEFILSQSNDINEQEALARYSEYKTEFTRRQIDKFFKEHQEEEWFRNKYRPTELKKIEEAGKESKSRRKELYNKLIAKQSPDNFFINYEHIEPLSIFLENFSLLLEGATIEELDDHEARKKYSVSCIFIPNLHPSIDKTMIEEYAQQHPGFLRVAMSEAQPDKGFKRCAWITYKQMDHDSITNLCWNYNTHKFNGHETKAVVNREMNNRIKSSQLWFCHADTAKADLKNIAKLLTYFDGEDCPLLDSIKDHLIEETNEEEKILGVNEENVETFEFKEDMNILRAVDKMILYLRLVHSYDYYASTEYVGEDDMPHKVGNMLARPMPPFNYGDHPQKVLREFIQAQQIRIDSFVEKPTLSEIEQKQLGKRNSDEEVENFIYQHTFEKKPGEKYVCKLTKKKFTAPEYTKMSGSSKTFVDNDNAKLELPVFVTPNELVFSIIKRRTFLTVFNPYGSEAHFKLMTTNPDRFDVSISRGIIKPNRRIDITIRLLANKIEELPEATDEPQLIDHFRISIQVASLCGNKQVKVNWCAIVDYSDNDDGSRINQSITSDTRVQKMKLKSLKQPLLGSPSGISNISTSSASFSQRNLSQQTRSSTVRSLRSHIDQPANNGSNINLVCFLCALICVIPLFLPLAIDAELCKKAKLYPEDSDKKSIGFLTQLSNFLSVSYEMKFGCSFALGLFTYRLISTMPD